MTRTYVGLTRLTGAIERYAGRYSALELALDKERGPKPGTLRKLRKQTPPSFAFVVVPCAEVCGLEPGKAFETGLEAWTEAALALEARAVLLTTPSSVRPTAQNRRKIADAFARFPVDGAHRVWAPSGLWEASDVVSFCSANGIVPALDIAQEEPPPGSVLYARLRLLGGQGLGPRAVEKVAEAATSPDRRESFVMVEQAATAKQIATAMQRYREGERPTRLVAGPTGPIIRPSNMAAEDEEQ